MSTTRRSPSPPSRASRECASTQYEQPLSCETRSRSRSIRVFGMPASTAARSADESRAVRGRSTWGKMVPICVLVSVMTSRLCGTGTAVWSSLAAESWASVDLHLALPPTRPPAQTLGDALRAAIRAGQLPPGTALPSTRALAGDLGVARGTVSSVYADLAAEGYLSIRHGAPTRVAAGVFAHVHDAGPAAPAGEPAPRWAPMP